MTTDQSTVDDLRGASETLLIPLASRARGSRERMASGFRDDVAEGLVARFGVDLDRYAASKPTINAVIARGAWFDSQVIAFLRAHPNGRILSVGSGLNTMFERVRRQIAVADWHWIDTDLAPVVDLRRQVFPDTEIRSTRALDVTDAGALAEILAAGRPTCLVAEGVLMYLPEPAVRTLFETLAQRALDGGLPCRACFDWCSPLMVRKSRKHPAVRRTKDTSIAFQWALKSPADIQRWHPAWTLLARSQTPMTQSSLGSRLFSLVHRALTGGRWFYGCATMDVAGT